MTIEVKIPIPENVRHSHSQKRLVDKFAYGGPIVKEKTIILSFFMVCFLIFFPGMGKTLAQTIEMDRKTRDVPYSILKVENDDFGIHDILNKDKLFSSKGPWKFNDVNAIYWVRLDFIDELGTLDTEENWRLRTLNFSKATLFYAKKDSIDQKTFGQFQEHEKRTSLIHLQGVGFKKQDLIDQRYLYLKVQVVERFVSSPRFEYLLEASNRFYTHYYTRGDLQNVILDHVYLGACMIFFLTFFIIFSYTKKAEFLYYALYIFFSALFLVRFFSPGYQSFIGTLFGYGTTLVSQVLINLFYILFGMYYLDTKRIYPKLHIAMRSVVSILMVLIVLFIYTHYAEEYSISNKILDIQRLMMSLFGIFSMIYLLINAKDKLATFLVMGSFIYMVGALLYMFTLYKYFMVIGSTLEIIIFSLGLAYKIRQEYETRLALQLKVSQKEMSALRAQMNPHFIFNSLNSIQHLILNNDKVSALKYLSSFGKLARNVLESSNEALVTLTDEIETIRSYLELESLRFDNGFEYSIEIDKALDTDNIEVPLLLIQPFVENAIVHGLLPKKEGAKKLGLRFEKVGSVLTFEIDDNGVGRMARKGRDRSATFERKSRGIEIAQKRLKMIHKDRRVKSSIEIIDKYDLGGNPSGTKIIIRIT